MLQSDYSNKIDQWFPNSSNYLEQFKLYDDIFGPILIFIFIKFYQRKSSINEKVLSTKKFYEKVLWKSFKS